MGRIAKLPPEVIRRIAAGEVIERPASCVKELIENAIDSGATRIDVDIEDGGKKLIRVSDNGCGILKEDLPLAVERHSTSKIKSEEDIQRVLTLGFRGEALPSMGEVSYLEILSRSEEEDTGGYIKVIGGEVVEFREAPRQRGTTVVVRELFFNYPARRKFLHSSRVEERYIRSEILPKLIAYPGITFSIRYGKKIERYYSGGIEERMIQVFGREFFTQCAGFFEEEDDVKVWGFVCFNPEGPLKKGFIFVNRRNVWHHGIHSLFSFPGYIVFIEISPEYVDVNVHPSKREVRFVKEEKILELVERGLRRLSARTGEGERKEMPEIFTEDLEKLWQLHGTYILAETKKGLLIIDQHVAHERILYEKLKKGEVPSQRLLVPIVLELSPHENEIFKEMLPHLERTGFVVKELSGGTWVVEAIPAVIPSLSPEAMREMIDDAIREGKTRIKMFDEALKIIACRGAIKAGEKLSREEMKTLIEELFSTSHPYTCPHGRPIIVEMEIREIDKKFGR